VLLPAQEQIDREMVGTCAFGERHEAAQDPCGERQVVAEAPTHREILLQAGG